MANLGTLTLDIVAKIGGYTAGLGSAEREAQKRAKAIEGAFDKAAIGVGVAFGLMTTAAVAAFAAINKGIEHAAQFQDLAEMTGGSAEGLASMAVAAATAGVSMESVASASNKLTKNLVGVDDESKATGAALKALNIELDTFKRLSPEERVDTLTKAFASFADGTGKTAVAMALWGKSGAEQLKLMKALEEQGGRSNILTKEQIKLADDFADRNAKLRAELGLYAAGIAAETLPALNELIKYTLLAGKEIFGLSGESSALGKNNGVRDFAQNAAVAISGFIDGVGNAVAAVGTLINASKLIGSNARLAVEAAATPFTGIANVMQGKGYLDNVKKAYAENQEQYDKLSKSFTATVDRGKAREGKSLRELFDQQNRLAGDPETARLLARSKATRDAQLKDLNFDGAVKPPKKGPKAAVDDPTKKLLENELANFKAMGDQAKEQLADRNRILDLYNQQGLLSVQDYYGGLKAAQDDALAGQVKAIEEQIAALQKFKDAAKKDTDVADTQGKINKLEEEKAKLYRQSGNAALESSFKQTQAQKAVQDAVNEVNAKLLEFNGNMREAAAIRFDAQNEKTRQMFTAEGNAEAVKALDTLRSYTLAQADVTKAQQDFALAQGDLQIAEERITIARERGTMGEIESLRASGEARQRAVALMEKHLAALLAINEAARSPEQVQAIERLKVQLEGLKATIDPLADKFNTMFSDAAGNAFGDFLTGAKSAKEAFQDFSKTVMNEISRMVAKDLAKSLFATAGDSGFNIGSMLSKLFGGATTGGISGTAKSAAEKSANATGGDDILGSFLGALGLGGAGAGSAAGATGAAASTTALATSATAATAAISALATAAAAAAAAMGASGATSVVGSLGSLASSLAGANSVGASGGDALGALIKLQGWSSGGFTGMGAANDPAGIVHKGEYVLDQATTKRLGVASLNRLNNGGTVGGGFTQNVNVTVGGTPTRKTPTHIAQEVRRQTVTAAARF